MRWWAMAAALMMLAACSSTAGPVAATPPSSVASPSGSASPSAPPRATAACGALASLGVLTSSGMLTLVGPQGCLAGSAAYAAPSVPSCAAGLPAVLAPPVSVSSDKVYFRDGDTAVRSLAPSGQVADVTTVPGGNGIVSFFSVSADDKRMAVMVEDFSQAATIHLQLFVRDLVGGGNRVDLYSGNITKGGNAMTMWPAGWHEGHLVVETVLACSAAPVNHPGAWKVLDAATGSVLMDIDVSTCHSGLLPSAGGVACFNNPTLDLRVYDWAGNVGFEVAGPFLDLDLPVGLSPVGQALFYNQHSNQTPRMWAQNLAGGGSMPLVNGHSACMWIDDSTILSPDAVIAYPSGAVSALLGVGQCVGRFPGGL